MLKNFCITVVSAILISVSTELLLPDGEIKKYARLVVGLIVIIVIMRPLVNLRNWDLQKQEYILATKNIECDTSGFEEMRKNQVRHLFSKRLASSIKEDLINLIEMKPEELKVEVVLGNSLNENQTNLENFEDLEIKEVNIRCHFKLSDSIENQIIKCLKKNYKIQKEKIKLF